MIVKSRTFSPITNPPIANNVTRPYLLTALLLDALETEGWKIGTGQQLRVQELLRQLPSDVDDDTLRLALAPLLARNPQEQSLVYEKLEECRRRADEMGFVLADPVTLEVAKANRALRRWYWRIWMPLALLSLLGFGLWLLFLRTQPQVKILKKDFIVNTGQTAHLCPPDFSRSDSLQGKVTDLRIKFAKTNTPKYKNTSGSSKQGERTPSLTGPDNGGESTFGTFFILSDTCLLYSAGDSLGQDSLVLNLGYSDGKKAELQLRIFISSPTVQTKTEEEGPKPPKQEPLFQQKPLPYPHDITQLAIVPPAPWIVWLAKWWPWLRWVVLGLLAAALFAAWQYWQQKRRKLIAELRNRDKPPYIWNIRIPGSDEIATGDDFAHVLQVLRRRASADAWRLDLKATIAATAERGGMPEFRFQQQTRPVDYLLLIDRQSQYNHRAQLYDALYRAFREQEIEIGRFFFDSDIRLCHNEDHPQGLRLTEIAQRYGDARLIVVGTGSQIISPLSGRVESWASIFQAWSESVLLSPKPPSEWGRNERRLSECFSAVLPASLQSLAFWVEETEAGDDARFEEWREYVHDTPAAFWQPDPEVPVPLLQLQYDNRMLRWIAACAIYPTLHYDLTLWLGKLVTGGLVTGTSVTGNQSNPTTNLPITNPPITSQPITLDDLSALFRLRWFVDGGIPQTARVALLDWLEAEDPALLAQTRLALADLLRQNPPPQDSAAWNDHALSVAITEWLATQDAKRRKELEKQIAQLLEAGAEADFVTLKYLDKPRGPLDFIVPDAWKKYIHPGGMPALGNRMWAIFGLVIGLLVSGGLVDWGISDWLNREMNRCSGQTVEYTPKPRFDNAPKTLMLCLDSPEDTMLWIERKMLDIIEAGDYSRLDTLDVLNELPKNRTGRFDTLYTESELNLTAAGYNKGVFYYQKNMKDSACLWFGQTERVKISAGNADYARARAWCGQPDTTTLPPVHLLGPISVTIVDAATRQPLSNARLFPQGMKPSTVGRKGGKLTITPPSDWSSPSVTLLVKAEGYVDSVFNLLVDSVLAFPVLGLREVPKNVWKILGVVRDRAVADRPIAGAEVLLDGKPTTFTDQAGEFILELSDIGSYAFEIRKEGYKNSFYSRRLDKTVRILNFELEKLPEEPASKPSEEAGTAIKPDGAQDGNSTGVIPIPEMVFVQGGTFIMGNDKSTNESEKPAHLVTVADFEIGKYEVTNAEFVAFLNDIANSISIDSNGRKVFYGGNRIFTYCKAGNGGCTGTAEGIRYNDGNKPGSRFSIILDFEKKPVVNVSWFGATAYCEWLTQKIPGKKFHLPTEAEWEYAARGGNASKGYKYSGSNVLDEVGWYNNNSGSESHPVGQKTANELNLYDMSGNAREWCADTWHQNYQGAPKDGSARIDWSTTDSALLRGGSWYYNDDFCRLTFRGYIDRSYTVNYYGFRCARVAGDK